MSDADREDSVFTYLAYFKTHEENDLGRRRDLL
jgi:hypothetical protein